MSENLNFVDGTHATLRPGDLTSATVEKVRVQLKELLSAGVLELTLDLEGVRMVDSMGLGLMMQTGNSLARMGGHLVLTHVAPVLMDLFRSLRLDQHIDMEG